MQMRSINEIYKDKASRDEISLDNPTDVAVPNSLICTGLSLFAVYNQHAGKYEVNIALSQEDDIVAVYSIPLDQVTEVVDGLLGTSNTAMEARTAKVGEACVKRDEN